MCEINVDDCSQLIRPNAFQGGTARSSSLVGTVRVGQFVSISRSILFSLERNSYWQRIFLFSVQLFGQDEVIVFSLRIGPIL